MFALEKGLPVALMPCMVFQGVFIYMDERSESSGMVIQVLVVREGSMINSIFSYQSLGRHETWAIPPL